MEIFASGQLPTPVATPTKSTYARDVFDANFGAVEMAGNAMEDWDLANASTLCDGSLQVANLISASSSSSELQDGELEGIEDRPPKRRRICICGAGGGGDGDNGPIWNDGENVNAEPFREKTPCPRNTRKPKRSKRPKPSYTIVDGEFVQNGDLTDGYTTLFSDGLRSHKFGKNFDFLLEKLTGSSDGGGPEPSSADGIVFKDLDKDIFAKDDLTSIMERVEQGDKLSAYVQFFALVNYAQLTLKVER